MVLAGDRNRYGVVAATLHWMSAFAILSLLGVGFFLTNAADTDRTCAFLRVHALLGVLVFGSTLARIAWWFLDERPEALAGQPQWQVVTARRTHDSLYLVLILMAAGGIRLMILSGAALIVFLGAPGPLPHFTDFPLMTAHAFGALVIAGLLCSHVGAVLYHQVCRRDRLLARMRIGPAQRGRR